MLESPDMPAVRKAVIPAAGLGTRVLPATKVVPKEMLPIVDTPAIQYAVEECVAAGIHDVLIVTGRGKRAIEDHFDHNPELEAELEAKGKTAELDSVRRSAGLGRVHAVRQLAPLGLGHAVSVARDHVGDDPFCVLLPDEVMADAGPLRALMAAHEATGTSVIGLAEVPWNEISRYGAAAVEPTDDPDVLRVTALVEKPPADEAPSNLSVAGRYLFTPEVFDALERITPAPGDELQLTDAMVLLLEETGLHATVIHAGRFDTGNKLDYLKANVELALRRSDLGPEFGSWLAEIVRRDGLR
jgi:UTP--glucose-1-phosphate uridylyltransferase